MTKECKDCWHNYHCPMPQEGYDFNPDTCLYNPDNDNRLAFAKTVYPDYSGAEVSQIIKLGYEDYLNSKNNIDNVVVTVEQRTYVKKKNLDNINITYPDGGQEVKYMKLENELQQLIDKNSGVS